jgi:hypothetical protein
MRNTTKQRGEQVQSPLRPGAAAVDECYDSECNSLGDWTRDHARCVVMIEGIYSCRPNSAPTTLSQSASRCPPTGRTIGFNASIRIFASRANENLDGLIKQLATDIKNLDRGIAPPRLPRTPVSWLRYASNSARC